MKTRLRSMPQCIRYASVQDASQFYTTSLGKILSDFFFLHYGLSVIFKVLGLGAWYC